MQKFISFAETKIASVLAVRLLIANSITTNCSATQAEILEQAVKFRVFKTFLSIIALRVSEENKMIMLINIKVHFNSNLEHVLYVY